ncbi:MAG: flagellar export chaperone FliS [Gammaproteobacteria bacterium]
MNYLNPQAALQQYKNLNASTQVASASPHRLIQMLLDGALEKIRLARSFMQQGRLGEKAQHITWAISIIDGLRVSLNKDAGGELAQHLEDLYDYMTRRLTETNLHNDPAILDEVAGLLGQIKEAWDAIGEQTGAPQPPRGTGLGG